MCVRNNKDVACRQVPVDNVHGPLKERNEKRNGGRRREEGRKERERRERKREREREERKRERERYMYKVC